MFPTRYFNGRYYAERFWPKTGGTAVDPVGQGIEYSSRGFRLEFSKTHVDRLNYSDKSPTKLDYSDQGIYPP